MKISTRIALLSLIVLPAVRANDPAIPDGLPAIFNGTDFSGWEVPKDNIYWTAKDQMITVENGPKKKGSILWTKKSYTDFSIDMEFRMHKGGVVDSGVFLREEKFQIQLGISGSKKRDMTGSIYIPGKSYPKEAAGVAELLKANDWNRLQATVRGATVGVWLNGKHVLTLTHPKPIKTGPIGLQLHAGKVMKVDFRNIKAHEL